LSRSNGRRAVTGSGLARWLAARSRRWLRFRRGCFSFAWPFPSLWSSSVTNSTDFLVLFGRGRIALPPFLAFLTQLLLVQIGLVLFISKTTAETSGGNGQSRCDFYWPAPRYHMPRAFIQRIVIRKRKLTITRSTLMRHTLSYRGRLESSNAVVMAVSAAELKTCRSNQSSTSRQRSSSCRLIRSICSGVSDGDLGSARDSRAGFGVSPKRTFLIVDRAN
jgi:hypothetical protein